MQDWGQELHPARFLRSPVLFEPLCLGSSHGRRKTDIRNFLEITIVLWRPRFIPADLSTWEAIQRGAFVVESWLVPLLGLIHTAVLITPDLMITTLPGSASKYHQSTLNTYVE